jgi:tetratricopeptide (TPR) repeat protein
MGLYTTREGVAVLHKANESGLWQAWRAEDGVCIIQALDVHRKPWGNFFSLGADDFFYALNSLPAENAAAVQRHFLRADSPYLLEAWFDQTQADQARGEGVVLGLLPEEAKILSFAEVFGGAPAKADPDRTGGEPEELQSADAPEGGLTAVADPDFPLLPLAGQDPFSPEESLSPDEQIVRREALMRVRFADLLVKIDDSAQTPVDADLQKLLQEEADFSWQQKYMFTEFGVALRRKGKKHLALLAHLRAHDLAPEDGHILFNLARSEYELGHISTAREYLARVLAVLPDFAPALNFLVFLNGQEHS